MSGMSVVIVLLVLAVGVLIVTYNRLVALRNRVGNAFAQIDVQLKRRHDLIPNLVEIARKYMSHERETLEAVVAARSRAASVQAQAGASPTDAAAIAAMGAAEGALTESVRRLFAVAEAYPDLKANSTMMQLSEELTSTENKVAFARQAYNDAVMGLNTGVKSFPAVLFAAALGFREAGMLEPIASAAEREVPAVKF
jgi:LemA protein